MSKEQTSVSVDENNSIQMENNLSIVQAIHNKNLW